MTPAYYQNASGEEALPSGNLIGLRHGDGITYGTWGLRPRVERLQIKLIEHGAVLKTDGMFGNETGAALRQFQASMGLPEQDIVDPATAEALDRYTPEPGEPSPISRIEGLKLNDGITYGTWDRRPRVRELQTRLTASGFFCEVDGMFGSKTADALHGFQAVNGLPQRDIVDRDTADALEGRKRGGTVPQCPPGYVPVTTEV
jgi:peptidoglycan hydrolase-like protein with peptidoglycan-binding domain